jgi:hypothetical protein
MPDAFDLLAQDHQEIKWMLGELELGAIADTGASPGLLAVRKDKARQLIVDVSNHEAIEELYFWPAVRIHLPDGDDLANQALGQEQDGKAILDRLDKLEPDEEEFEAQLAQFASAGRAHIIFEETTVWPALRAALTAQEADHLGQLLEEAKKIAPTRPHPTTPASPGTLKTAGPAATDRLRDEGTDRDE